MARPTLERWLTRYGDRLTDRAVSQLRQVFNLPPLPGIHPGQPRTPQATCRRGHVMTPANTYLSPSGTRVCRECQRHAGQRYDQKRRGKKGS